MYEMILKDFLILWTTVDPIGTLALFTGITAGLSDEERHNVAKRATFYATAVLMFSMVAGQFILSGMGIRLISLQVAGGIILFLFAFKMIFSRMETSFRTEENHDISVFPLAIPSIATPGAIMAVILLTDNNLYTIGQQTMTAGVLLVIMLITYVFMVLSSRILRVIGKSGANILVKVMGMLLAALSVELIMEAVGIEKWLEAEA